MTRALLMGILNITPDSFSDGGQYLDHRAAIEKGLAMAEEGADFIDVGGESTRPGSAPVPAEEEMRRTIPVVEALANAGLKVSIDTSKAVVAAAALEVGAAIVNDVSAFRDPAMAGLCAEAKCGVCLMHMQGRPQTMQAKPHYDDVIAELHTFFGDRIKSARDSGIDTDKVWLDPGIGFGKTTAHNLDILNNIESIRVENRPILIGVSRKSLIGRLLGTDDNPAPVEDRNEGTLALEVLAQANGANIIRTHDVRAAHRALTAAAALQ
jgi:dihydropteroate synthase